MVNVEIMQELCTGCGLCAKDCPARNLLVTDGKASARGGCMGCGHCFAICPAGAVRIPEYPADGIEEFPEHRPPVSGDELLRLIKSRRSIRDFRPEPVGRDVWEKLLEAGRFTATARNDQDVRCTVVQDELEAVRKHTWEGFLANLEQLREQGGDSQTVRKLQAMYDRYKSGEGPDPLFFNAPSLLILTAPNVLDGGLAASSIELMARAMGLGALYSGFIQRSLAASEAGCSLLGIEEAQIRACLLLGWPNVRYRRSAPRRAAAIQWR